MALLLGVLILFFGITGTVLFDDFKNVYSEFLILNDFLCFLTKSGVWFAELIPLTGIFMTDWDDWSIVTFYFLAFESLSFLKLNLYGLSNEVELFTLILGIP